ncbi:hypothetical protein GQ42DRAFT_78471, partial [Ramicandelaber brevisporus]
SRVHSARCRQHWRSTWRTWSSCTAASHPCQCRRCHPCISSTNTNSSRLSSSQSRLHPPALKRQWTPRRTNTARAARLARQALLSQKPAPRRTASGTAATTTPASTTTTIRRTTPCHRTATTIRRTAMHTDTATAGKPHALDSRLGRTGTLQL